MLFKGHVFLVFTMTKASPLDGYVPRSSGPDESQRAECRKPHTLPTLLPSAWLARILGSEHRPRSTALSSHQLCAGLTAQACSPVTLVLGTLVSQKGGEQLLMAQESDVPPTGPDRADQELVLTGESQAWSSSDSTHPRPDTGPEGT